MIYSTIHEIIFERLKNNEAAELKWIRSNESINSLN